MVSDPERLGSLKIVQAIDAFVNLPMSFFIILFLMVRGLDTITAYTAFKLNPLYFLKAEQNETFVTLVTTGNFLPFLQAQLFWFVTFVLILYAARLVYRAPKFSKLNRYLEPVIYAISLYIIGYCIVWSTIGAISNIIAIFGV